MIPAGVVHEDERKRTAVEVSKRYELVSKLEECSDSRISVADDLFPGHTASGMEAARAWNGLLRGT
jgi:hypothetical protein